MSEKENAETIPKRVLVDADVFISYLTSDKLSVHAERVVDKGRHRAKGSTTPYGLGKIWD